jgi:hypothetical protein
MYTGAVFFAHKKRITGRNSHLAGEASGSYISNGCQAKTERRRQLAGAGTGRGETKLHATAPGSRVTAFLATAAPWEPYFTDNLRIYGIPHNYRYCMSSVVLLLSSSCGSYSIKSCCLCVCMLLGNGSANTLPRQQIHKQE